MATVKRSATIGAPVEEVWELVSDPRMLARWWSGVERVEEAQATGWTKVFRSERGKELRADFTRTELEPGQTIAWRHEIAGSPFERFMSEERARIAVSPADGEGTRVEISLTRRMRGLAVFGGYMVRRAARKQLDDSLAALADDVTG